MAALHFPSFAFKLPTCISSLRDTADRPPLLYAASQRYDRRFSASSIRSDGNRPVREEDSESVDNTSKKQDEIIAVFRRIQKSISNGEAVVAPKKKTSSKQSRDKSSAESVLEVLRLSSKKVKGKNTKQEVIETSGTRRGWHKKEEQEVDDEEQEVLEDVKPTRPLSKFVRRSPISQAVGAKRQNSEALAGGKEDGAVKVDEMKVTELKQVAKSRGIKGYSKLNKSELQALLRP